MAEENTDVEATNEMVDAAPGAVTKGMANQPDKSGLYAIIIIVIVLILAGVGFFFLQGLRSEQEDIDTELNKEEEHLLQLGKRVNALNDQLATVQSQMATFTSPGNAVGQGQALCCRAR